MAKKKSSLGILFWIAFILLGIVIFLFNKSRIDSVMESTGFIDVVKNKIGLDEKPEVQVVPLDENQDLSPGGSGEKTQETVVLDSHDEEKELPQKSPPTLEEQPHQEQNLPSSQEIITEDNSAESADPPLKEKNLRKARLFFVLVDDEGRINIKASTRSIYYTDSPLTATLHELLSGPSREDLSQGLMTLIPENTKLLSAYVKDGIAFLNFSENFRFNSLGVDGYIAQLKQIIYSATEYQTVKQVQFLIEGKKIDYLTAEGLYIGKPIGRESL